MTPEELTNALIDIFGPDYWKSRAAEAFGVHRSTVGRWAAGETKVPGPVVAWIRQRKGEAQ